MRFHNVFCLLITAALIVPASAFLAGCDNTEEVVLPARIIIESGDNQLSKQGTQLPAPLVVRVQYHDLSAASGIVVEFTVIEGGGAVSKRTDATDGHGIAAVNYTLGPDLGTNRIRAAVTGEVNLSVVFTATSSEYYCPEEDPTFIERFPPGALIENDLLLFTRESSLNKSDGQTVAGIVRLEIEGGFFPVAFASYEEGFGRIPTRDCAFGVNGNLYLSWQDIFDEIVKIRPNKRAEHFAMLETGFGGEITSTPSGVLVGADIYGPFVVGCRDTLQRFEEALYSGAPGDQVNGDAVAVDVNPQNAWYEDIYFIDLTDNTLRRLPVDTLVATGPSVVVAQLTADEATGARGMECNDNGDVFILVDDDNDRVKEILRVTPAGVQSVEFDFFTRGTGSVEDAGMQRDLAIRKGGNPILYTIDTWNNVLLRYDVGNQILSEFAPDVNQGMDPESISTEAAYGERVGLVVIPSD